MMSKLSITLVALLGLGLVISGWLLAPQHVFAGGDVDDDGCGSSAAAAAAEDSAAAATNQPSIF